MQNGLPIGNSMMNGEALYAITSSVERRFFFCKQFNRCSLNSHVALSSCNIAPSIECNEFDALHTLIMNVIAIID